MTFPEEAQLHALLGLGACVLALVLLGLVTAGWLVRERDR